MNMTRGKIVVFGATGYTGSLLVEALVRRGERPVLAGRSAEELAEAAEAAGGLDYRIADVTDPDSVRALVEFGDVLASTVGPFERDGMVAAEAAAQAGAHYIDSTSEVGFVRELLVRCGDQAAAAGVTMLPAFAFAYVPGILAGALATERAGDTAHTLRVGYFTTGPLGRRGLSKGTRSTVAEALTLPVVSYREGELVTEPPATDLHTFRVEGEQLEAFRMSGTETLFLPDDFPRLQVVEVYNGWYARFTKGVKVVSRAANAVAQNQVGRRAVEFASSLTVGGPGGPDADERAKTKTRFVAEVTSRVGRPLAQVQLEGPSIYTLTAELMAVATRSLAAGDAQSAGVVGPIQAFGLQGLSALAEEVGLAPVSS